jgi:hypothetical protein
LNGATPVSISIKEKTSGEVPSRPSIFGSEQICSGACSAESEHASVEVWTPGERKLSDTEVEELQG